MIFVRDHGDFFIVRCACEHEFEATPDTWVTVKPPIIQCPACDELSELKEKKEA